MIINKLPSSFLVTLVLGVGLFVWVALASLITAQMSFAEGSFSCAPDLPYEAPQYVEPAREPEISRLRLIENGDGTITDPDSGLQWTQKDSFADLGRCLAWQESMDYVEWLETAGHKDWRMPTIKELSTLYDPTKENNMAWDHNPEYPLMLDEKFADGAAYWYWSSDSGEVDPSKGCTRTLYFVKGLIHLRNLNQCNNGGVRAVRSLKQ